MHRSFPLRELQYRTERKVRPSRPQVLIGRGHDSRKYLGADCQNATRDHRQKNKFCAKRKHAAV